MEPTLVSVGEKSAVTIMEENRYKIREFIMDKTAIRINSNTFPCYSLSFRFDTIYYAERAYRFVLFTKNTTETDLDFEISIEGTCVHLMGNLYQAVLVLSARGIINENIKAAILSKKDFIQKTKDFSVEALFASSGINEDKLEYKVEQSALQLDQMIKPKF